MGPKRGGTGPVTVAGISLQREEGPFPLIARSVGPYRGQVSGFIWRV